MINIVYRHYKPGDEVQLADLFNRAFQMNGAGMVRTPKKWLWRYVQSPGFEPEQCQLAEDIDKNKLVGAIYVNLVEKVPFDDGEYLVGDINDVSCLPDYTGQGIAKKLMDMSVDYMKKKGCDLSMLTADYPGFPRKKIYLPYGYNDVDRQVIFINFPNILRFARDLPIAASLLSTLFTLSLIPRFINRIRIKFNSFFKNFSYEINHKYKHLEFMKAANRIMPKYYTGFPIYTKEKVIWSRMKAPVDNHKPTYIVIKNKEKIIGGATITHQNIYSFKFGIKIRVGIVHNIFLDNDEFDNKRNLHFGYTYLADKLMKAFTQRNVGVFFIMLDSREHALHRALRSMCFLKAKAGATMIKPIDEKKGLPKIKKPIFVPTYVSTGVP